MPLKKTIPYKFIAIVCVFLVLDFILENINHKFQLNDFKVYYGAAKAITNGGQVYTALFSLGSGYYKYSPFTALVFYPLTLLPYYFSCLIDFILISAATLFTSVILLNIVSEYIFRKPASSANLALSLSVLCISTHLVRELELGNVNVILLFLLSFSIYSILNKNMTLAGILLALVVITKPYFILVFIPLFVHRYYKSILICLAGLVVCIILPAIFFGFSKDVELHTQWLNTMLTHAEAFPSPNTIEAVIRTQYNSPISSNFQYVILLLLLIPYLLYLYTNNKNSKNNQPLEQSNLIIEWFILIAVMPSIFKTDTEHFLMTFPILIFIMIYLFDSKNLKLSILFAFLAILFAGNSSDLLGKNLSLQMYSLGILGISNVLLISFGLFLYYKHYRKTFFAVQK